MRVAVLGSSLFCLLLALPAAAQEARFSGRESERPGRESREKDRKPEKERSVPLAEQSADAPPLAIVGADIHPVIGEPILGGTILLRDGRIEAILDARGKGRGRRRSLDGYERLDATGLRAYPGLVAPGAEGLGVDSDFYAGAAAEALTRRVVDSHDAWAENLEFAASAGITSAFTFVVPFGASGPISTRGDVLKVSPGEPRGVLLKEAAAAWGSREILGAKGAHDLRKLVAEAREWAAKPKSKRKEDAGKQLLVDIAEGRVPLYVPASEKGEISATLALAEEIGFRPVFYQPTEAWVLAKELATAEAAVIQHVRTNWGKSRDDRRGVLPGGWRFDAPTILHRAGVPTAVLPLYDSILTWGVAGRDLTNFPLEAAFAQRGGLSPQEALESITIVPARLLGVADRVGSLAVGKDADVILVDGDLLDYRAFVRKSIVNGRVVYDAETSRFWSGVVADRVRSLADGS